MKGYILNMKKNNDPISYMKKHYFKREDFSTLQEMLYYVGKGITLTKEELIQLKEALNSYES